MATTKTDYHDVLSRRIEQLHTKKQQQEEGLKRSFDELTDSLNPLQIMKQSVHDMVTDRELKDDLIKIGLSLSVNFLIGKIWKRQTVRSYLSAAVAENISNTLINNGTASELVAGLATRATTLLLKSSS
ncbi:MAG: hypothetical protein NWR72_13020 [Bacteroidia bacterium]|nr:hypothetical protein [Bacteroidia bacterium]